MVELDDEEREILRSFEAGEWIPVAEREAELRKARQMAAATRQRNQQESRDQPGDSES